MKKSDVFTLAPKYFASRLEQGKSFEKEVFAAIEQMGLFVAMNGTEHTHPIFVSRLRQSNDETSMYVRFQPDGVVGFGKIPHTAFVEAKSSRFIEKDAYKEYMKLSAAGLIVLVVFNYSGVWFWNKIENIVMSLENHRDWPVIGQWICPREDPLFHRKKQQGFRGSGTPYRPVEKESLRQWDEFELYIKQTLQRQ